MTRKQFDLTYPYRELIDSDAAKQFKNELFPNGDVLADLIILNVGNTHVFVYEQNREILAFLMFDDNETCFHIEFVATNRIFQSKLRPSTKLIHLLENLGKSLKYDKIELWSLNIQIPYYQNLGFSDTKITEIGNYGPMSKMVKSLASN